MRGRTPSRSAAGPLARVASIDELNISISNQTAFHIGPRRYSALLVGGSEIKRPSGSCRSTADGSGFCSGSAVPGRHTPRRGGRREMSCSVPSPRRRQFLSRTWLDCEGVAGTCHADIQTKISRRKSEKWRICDKKPSEAVCGRRSRQG